MAEVIDAFELRHVSTTYSEDKDIKAARSASGMDRACSSSIVRLTKMAKKPHRNNLRGIRCSKGLTGCLSVIIFLTQLNGGLPLRRNTKASIQCLNTY